MTIDGNLLPLIPSPLSLSVYISKQYCIAIFLKGHNWRFKFKSGCMGSQLVHFGSFVREGGVKIDDVIYERPPRTLQWFDSQIRFSLIYQSNSKSTLEDEIGFWLFGSIDLQSKIGKCLMFLFKKSLCYHCFPFKSFKIFCGNLREWKF